MKDLLNHGEDTWGIRDLQNCILNIAQYIDSFCESNGIDYCLMGGSALGAVRHKGLIPWDDDLDIFMTPENYKKFRERFYEKGDKQTYYLQEWGAKDGKPSFAKLRLNKSHYVEPDLESLKIHKGVFVDIFILHTCPDNYFSHLWQYFWSRYLVIKSLADYHSCVHDGVFLRGVRDACARYLPRGRMLEVAAVGKEAAESE